MTLRKIRIKIVGKPGDVNVNRRSASSPFAVSTDPKSTDGGRDGGRDAHFSPVTVSWRVDGAPVRRTCADIDT